MVESLRSRGRSWRTYVEHAWQVVDDLCRWSLGASEELCQQLILFDAVRHCTNANVIQQEKNM
jgi:hypothetical protein